MPGKAVLCLVEPAAQLGLLRVRALHVRVFPQLLAQLLQLVCDLVRGAAGIVDDALRLGAGRAHGLFAFALDLGVIGLGLLLHLLRFLAQALGLELGGLHLLALLLELVQDVLKVAVIFVHEALCLVDDRLRQAEAAGNGKGVRFAGDADEQAVGRPQRLHVELARGVHDALRAHGIELQLGIVRRGRHAAAALAAELDERIGERRTLGRVRARAQLVKQHERVAVTVGNDVDDILHVGGEGGQRLLDGLLVADVRQHLPEDGDGAAVVRRNVQAALRHQCQKADGLERDGLAAGVWAGDDERVEIRAEPQRDGNDLLAVDERMAGPDQLQTGVRANFRLHAVHLVRQARAGEDAVELHEHLVAVADALAERGRLGRQCGQNAFDLLFLADQQLTQGVVRIDGGHRLDEERAARRGHIVDQTGNFTLVFALDRHNIAVAAQRDDRVTQILGKARRGDDLLQRILDLCALDAHMAADIRQLAAGRVGDLLLGEDGVRDLLLKIAIRRKLLKIDIQHGRLAVLAVIGLDIADAAQHARNAQQLHGRQAAAAVGALQAGRHRLQFMEARRALADDHAAGSRRLLLEQTNFLRVVQRLQRAAAVLAILGVRAVGKLGQHVVQLQLAQRFFV